jgi:hypothetical protein
MDHNEDGQTGTPLVSNRAMEMAVAVLLLAGGAIVISDSWRIGFGWEEGVGPAPGYFPFWIAVILGLSSLVILANATFRLTSDGIFVGVRPFGRVLAVLAPSLVYVALIGGLALGPVALPGIGIYIASLIFIFAFMIAIGREPPLKAVWVALLVAVALFVMFEKLFLVPLPKCGAELCNGLEELIVGTPYDWLRDQLMALLRALRIL